jgi:WD40 repeat protein
MPFQDQAKDLLASLVNEGIGSRPVAFITHSLGGILIKQALRVAEPVNSEFHSVFTATRLVVFVATPHTGSSLANVFAHMQLFHIGSNEALQLRTDAPPLRDLSEWYRIVAPNTVRTAAFYETRKLHGALVVPQSSADPGVVLCTPIPVAADHSTIAKPASHLDAICQTVSRLLREAAVPCTAQVDHTRQMRMAYPAGQKWSQTAAQVRERVDLLLQEFYGRAEWLTRLNSFVTENRSGLIILTGPGGVGKSALMARWVQMRVSMGDVVARHFTSTQFDKTSTPEQALGHLLVQFRDPDGEEPIYFEHADALGQSLYDLLRQPDATGKLRIIVLDGLDETSADIPPFVETPLADRTFVVVTARVGDAATPPFLVPWTQRLRRRDSGVHWRLGGLNSSETQLWIETLFPGLDDAARAVAGFEEGAQGLPLFLKYVLEDFASRYQLTGESSLPSGLPFAELPRSLKEYIETEMIRPTRPGEPPWDSAVRSLFAILTQARGPLEFDELKAIRTMVPDLSVLATRFSRWLVVSDGEGQKQISFGHLLLRKAFAAVLGEIECGKALKDLVSWALTAWKPEAGNNALFAEEHPRANYSMRWLIEHLLEIPNTGLPAARVLLLDPEWLERKVTLGYESEALREFSALEAKLVPEESTLVRLVADAFRNHLYQIIEFFGDYPQILTQVVLNYLRPLQQAGSAGDPSPALEQSMVHLAESWEARARRRGWSWIQVAWLARSRTYLGEQLWQTKIGGRPASHVAFSPLGDYVAAGAKWPYSNRLERPREWPMAYDIAVLFAGDGKFADRPCPDSDSVPLDDPPENIPRPDEVNELFRAYFAHRKQKRESPAAPDVSFDLSKWTAAPDIQTSPIAWDVGKNWAESLLAGDVDPLVWLDERTLLVSARGGRIFVFDTVARAQVALIQQSNVDSELAVRGWQETEARSLARISNTEFAAGTAFGKLEVRDLRFPSQLKEYRIEPVGNFVATRNRVLSLAYHEQSGYLAIGLLDHSIRLFETGSGLEVRTLQGHSNDVIGLSWAPSGTRLASVSYDQTLRIWNTDTGGEIITPIKHPMDTISVAWGFDDEQVLTAWNENGKGGALRIWSASTGKLLSEFGAGPALIQSIAVSRGIGRVAAGGKDGYVRVFDPTLRGMTRSPMDAHSYGIREASLSVSRMELATLSLDGILVWSCKSGQVAKTHREDWTGYIAWSTKVIYSPGEDYLVAVVGNFVHMFDAETLHRVWQGSIGSRDLRFCRFSTDGKYLLTDDDKDSPDGSGAVLWDVLTGKTILRNTRHGFEVEEFLSEHENRVAERVSDRSAGLDSAGRWKSSKRLSGNRGSTQIHLTYPDGASHDFMLEAAVQEKFQLPATGQWIFILSGANAPVIASVV